MAGRWFSQGTPVSYTDKTDRQDITEILFKVVLNTITLTLTQIAIFKVWNILPLYICIFSFEITQ